MSSLPSAAENLAPLPGAAPAAAPAFSPLYRQIKDLLLQSLQQGEWKPGEAIPSETGLAARFRVSQGTVRKAIDELAAGHLLMRRQGKGTFVTTHAEQQVQYRFLKLRPDTDTTRAAGPTRRQVVECRRVHAGADVARALALRSTDVVVQARRILSFAGVPTILEDLWLPGQAFKGLSADQLANYQGPTYAMFELDFGVRMLRAEEKIRAVLPDAVQAQLLQISATTPLLSVERIAYTYNDLPMELRRGLYRTETHHYRNVLS